MKTSPTSVIPAHAGIQLNNSAKWIPAFAGMTIKVISLCVRRIITSCFLLITYHLSLITAVYAKQGTLPQPPAGGNTGVDIGKIFGFGDIKSLGEATSRLVTPAFSIAAAVVIIYFLLGAFKYLKSGGNKEEVEAARLMMTHAIVGFLILMFAFLSLQFLLSSLFGDTGLQIIKT